MRTNHPYNQQKGSTGRLITSERLLFAFLLMASLIPLFAFRYIPSVDLPNHILLAALHADVPGSHYLSAEWVVSPYILFYVLMYPFVKLFGYLIASKIVLGLYVIGLPLSVRWFYNEFNPDNRFLSLYSFAFIYTYFFDFGFIPYVIGVPLVFCGLTVLGRTFKQGFPLKLMLLSSVMSLLIYLSHFMNFAAYGIGVLVLILSSRYSHDNSERSKISFSSQIANLAFIFAPSLALLVLYVANMLNSGELVASSQTIASYSSPYHQFAGAIRFFLTKNMVLDAVRVGLFGVIAIVLMVFREKVINRGFLLYFGIAVWAASVIIPRGSFIGGWELSSRMAVFGAISVIGSVIIKRTISRKLVVIIAVILSAISIGQRAFHTRFIDRMTASYVNTLSATIPSGSRICPVSNAFLEANVPYMMHAIAYYHLEHGGFSPFLFSDQPQVAGIKPNLQLPRLHESWVSSDTSRFMDVLPHYDYLAIITYGEGLPQPFTAMSDGFVHSDTICTVIDLSKTVYSRDDRDPVR